MISFSGKRGIITGIANQRSIAAAVTKQLHALGAELALSHGPDPKGRFSSKVEEMGKEVGAKLVAPMDVSSDESIADFFTQVRTCWPTGIDFMVHSVAFADRQDLEKPFSSTSREGWNLAQEISAYSLLAMCRESGDLFKMRGGGSVVALSFIGSMLAVPYYHVMGPAKAALESSIRYLAREYGPDAVRFNALSAGALRTLSSSGIKHFGELLRVAGEHSALLRNVTVEEVAAPTVFLLSDAASGMTGQTIYVDGGFNVMAN